MSQTCSPSSGRPYGLARTCRVLGIARSTVYAQRARRRHPVLVQRRGPKPAWTDAELIEHIRQVLAGSPFAGEGYRQVWTRLRLGGIRTSRARVLRRMRAAGLLAPRRLGYAHGPAAHDSTIIPDRPDTLWGTDATSALTAAGPATIFVAVDHFTAECVGIHAARHGTRFAALDHRCR